MLTNTTNQTQAIITTIPDRWQALRFFNLYRVLLSCIFLALYSFGLLGNQYLAPGMHPFLIATSIYALYTLLSILASVFKYPEFALQVTLTIIMDILALTLVMHTSGGLMTGIGMLIIVAIAVGSLLTSLIIRLVFAATATLAILLHAIIINMTMHLGVTTYTQAGILGILFFSTAIVITLAAKRINDTEALAKRRRTDLIALERLNAYIVQHMDIGVIAIDAQQQVKLVNEAALTLLDIQGTYSQQPLTNLSKPLAHLLYNWQQQHCTSACHFQPFPNSAVLTAEIKAVGSQTISHVILIQDASVMRQKALQMKLASLGRLTASIAHEIRNPLSAINHATQLLKESTVVKSNESRFIEIIQTHAHRLNAVIENILQLSKHQKTEPQTIHLHSWLYQFKQQFSVHDFPEFNMEIQVCVDAVVQIDAVQLHQILTNLCENGLRHGCIDDTPLALSLHGYYDKDPSLFHLDILDQGPGVDKLSQQSIFKPFFTTHNEGTGLGLYIAKELCEANNALLSYVDRKRGGCFKITFKNMENTRIEPYE